MTEKEIIKCFNIDENYRDDTAFLSQLHLTTATDSMAENSHFRLDWSRPAFIARKLVIANAADFLAAGASIEYALLNLGLTAQTAEKSWIEGFAAGLKHYLGKFGTELVGGDTFFAPTTVVSLTLLGHNEAPRRLSDFAPGQTVKLTGRPGYAYIGLKLLMALGGDEKAHEFLTRLVPELLPKERNLFTQDALTALQQGSQSKNYPAWIRQAIYTHLLTAPLWGWGEAGFLPGQNNHDGIRATTDISDGLLNEIHKVIEHTGVGFRLNMTELGVPNEFKKEAWLEAVFLSGEEYHLVMGGDNNMPGILIGEVVAGGKLEMDSELTGLVSDWGEGKDWHQFH